MRFSGILTIIFAFVAFTATTIADVAPCAECDASEPDQHVLLLQSKQKLELVAQTDAEEVDEHLLRRQTQQKLDELSNEERAEQEAAAVKKAAAAREEAAAEYGGGVEEEESAAECSAGYYAMPVLGCWGCVGGSTRRRRATECTPCKSGFQDVGDYDDCEATPTPALCPVTQFYAAQMAIDCNPVTNGKKRIDLPHKETSVVAVLPQGAKNVTIAMSAPVNDVDIHLCKATNHTAKFGCKKGLNSLTVKYQCDLGFNCKHGYSYTIGEENKTNTVDGLQMYFSGDKIIPPVVESIKVSGALKHAMVLDVHSYSGNGSASVNYSHDGVAPCQHTDEARSCRECSEYEKCPPGEVPHCDGSHEVTCAPAPCPATQYYVPDFALGCGSVSDGQQNIDLPLKKTHTVVVLPAGASNVNITMYAPVNDVDIHLCEETSETVKSGCKKGKTSENGTSKYNCVLGFNCEHGYSYLADEASKTNTVDGLQMYFSGDKIIPPVMEAIRVKGALKKSMVLDVHSYSGNGRAAVKYSYDGITPCQIDTLGCSECKDYTCPSNTIARCDGSHKVLCLSQSR